MAPTYDAATHGLVFASLTAAFAELRQLAESGAISHPYSMREAVATARHLERTLTPYSYPYSYPYPYPYPCPYPGASPRAIS